MDIRFDWTARFKTDIFEPLIQFVSDLIDQDRSHRGLSSEQLKKIRLTEQFTLRSIIQSLYIAYFTIPHGTARISLPLTASFYSRSFYQYRIVKRIYDKLVQESWIDSKIGQEGHGYTRIWAIGKLSLRFNIIGFQWFEQELIPYKDLVILRDYKSESSKIKITVTISEENSEVHNYRNLLSKYNNFISKHCVAFDLENQQLISFAQEMAEKANEEVSRAIWLSEKETQQIAYLDFSRIQLVRIFARGSLEKGGRFYRGWWQSIPSKYRPHITIDGKKTCEMDFSGIAIYIMYAKEGIQFPHDRDPYDIGLDNWQGNQDARRKLIKRFFNAIINDETGRFRLSHIEQEQFGISHKELLARVLEVHEPIVNNLTTGRGLETQFIDSQIASYIMDEMVDRGIVILPIHDSFIVRLGYDTELMEVMLKAFNHFTQMYGQVTTDYPRLSKHFNMSDEEFDQEVIRLKDNPEESIISVEDIFDSIIEQRSSVMEGYVSSWEEWSSRN